MNHSRRNRQLPASSRWCAAWLLCALVFISLSSAGQTLTGRVKNGTSNKPAAGDEVVVLNLGQGMEEAGRTKTDSKGNFSFKLSDPGPHLVRAIHDGVTYHRMAPPGTTSVELEVYDAAKKLDSISVTADVMRFQAQGDQLMGLRLFAVNNASDPPRTQMNDQNFEFYLPEGAEIDESMAKTAGGQPINSAPVPQKEKNRYAFVFPLRPGETQFQVGFHLPYKGQATIDPKALYPAQHFVVMLPQTMQFTGGTGTAFQSMKDPQQADTTVQVVSGVQLGQPLSFKISGTGLLPAEGRGEQTAGQSGGEPQRAMGGRDARPGGGLGPPIDAPDPLEKYRYYILGGFGLVLAAGAIYIARRPAPALPADFAPADLPAPKASPSRSTQPIDRSALLLEALKEEIFQLEVDRKQGHISQPEYEKAKAALDQTLERALKRKAGS